LCLTKIFGDTGDKKLELSYTILTVAFRIRTYDDIDMKEVLKKIGFVWLVYIAAINLFVLLLDNFHSLNLKVHTIKEIFFAVWGYGWDGMHFITIATKGYSFPLQAFFPLYPLIIKFINLFLPLTIAYRVNIILLCVVLFLWYFFMDRLGIRKERKLKVLVLMLVFPTAFFLQANYVETLYIIISAVGLLFLLKKKYFLAALMAGLLSATKVSGISLGVIVLFSFIYSQIPQVKNFPKKLPKFILTACLLGLISFSGLILFGTFLNSHFGSFQIFFKAQAEWGRLTVGSENGEMPFFGPLIKAITLRDNTLYRRLNELAAVILSLFLLKKSFKKIPNPIWWFSSIQILIPLASGTFLSFNRLVLLAYPLLLFGFSKLVEKRFWYYLVLVLFIIDQLWGVYLFTTGVFVG